MVTRKILFLGGTRYSCPLSPTSEKKFLALRSLGAVFVIGFSGDIYPRRFMQHAHFYLMPKLPFAVMRYGEMFLLGPLLVLWIIFRHGVRILIAQSPYEGVAAAVAKTIAGYLGREVVLVVENHGDFEQSLFMQRRILVPSLYRFLMRRAARYALQQADLLRAVSTSTRAQLQRLAPDKQIHQFPAWTDIDVFLQAGSQQRGGSFCEVLYAGVLIPRKGVHHLINAFSRVATECSSARLVIVGSEENRRYALGLKRQVSDLCLDSQVRFVENVSQQELAEGMARARVLVLPSISEALGRVVFEAMACGTPVIGSQVDGIVDMIEDGETGFLVPPVDEDALATRIRWVLEHPEEAGTMGRHARAFAESFFSAGTYVRGYAKLLGVALERSQEESSMTPQPKDG